MYPLLIKSKQSLSGKIYSWQNSQTDLVHAAGYEEASWVCFANISAATYLDATRAFHQSGDLVRVKLQIGTLAVNGGTYKIKVFRWNGGTSLYDLVGEQSFVITAAGLATVTLDISPPITVQIGDIPGFWSDSNFSDALLSGGKIVSAVGDISASNAFSTLSSDRALNFELFIKPPYLAVTGESIPEGHNTASNAHGGLHVAGYAGEVKSIPWPVATAEIMAQLKAIIGSGSILKYQNLALGSQTFAWAATTGIAACVAAKPKVILVHCGVNDVSTARSWANVDTDLDTIKAAIPAGTKLLIDEILPWTAGTDEQAATIRTWNTNLAIWCAANDATLVRCHDAMGQVRAGTGELDDLKTTYDHDGVHLTAAGVLALATIWRGYL